MKIRSAFVLIVSCLLTAGYSAETSEKKGLTVQLGDSHEAKPAVSSGAPSIAATLLAEAAANRPALAPGLVSLTTLDEKLQARLDEFFSRLKRGDARMGYSKLLEGSRIGQKQEVVEKLISQTQDTIKKYGKFEDAELVHVTGLGKRLRDVIYVSSSEQHPLRWRFICYESGGFWQLLDIKVSGDLDVLLPDPLAPGAGK